MATFQYPLDLKSVNYNATVTFQAVKLRSADVATVLGVFDSFQSQDGDTADHVAVTAEPVGTDATAGTGRRRRPGLTPVAELYGTPELEVVRVDGYTGPQSAAAKMAEANPYVPPSTPITSTEASQHRGQANQTVEGTGQEVEERLQSCKLYLPQGIQIADGAQYENINLGVMGGATAAALQSGANLASAVMEGVVETTGGIIDAFRTRSLGAAQARLAVSRASQLLPGEQATGAVQSATRTVVNPNTRAIFRSVPLREFTFTFKLIPTSSAEAKMITSIVNFFRTELYPTVIRLGSDGNEIQAGYEFPNVFEINMMYKDTKQLATKILPSYLRNFTASYNASGMGFHDDGEFSEVDISMTFIESSTLHKELIGKGY
tara:strand:+ start:1564 stop:2694 length:1131 start_codon:yes stop_codon:yes gene_type:complete